MDAFEEDVNVLQQKLIEDGASFTKQQDSADSDSGQGQTPTPFHELPSPKPPFFNDPFSLPQLPPTPLIQGPYPHSDHTTLTNPATTPITQIRGPQADVRTSMNPVVLQNQSWGTPIIYEGNMDFIQQLELPTMCQGISGDYNRQLMAMSTISPRVAAPEWNEDDFNDFSAFLNPTIMA